MGSLSVWQLSLEKEKTAGLEGKGQSSPHAAQALCSLTTSLFCFDPGSHWAQQSLIRREKPTILHTFAFSAVYFTKTFKPVSESVSSPGSVVIISLLRDKHPEWDRLEVTGPCEVAESTGLFEDVLQLRLHKLQGKKNKNSTLKVSEML